MRYKLLFDGEHILSTGRKEVLERVVKAVRLCYQCGTCAGGCPVFRNNQDMNPRIVVEKLLLGREEEVVEALSAWNCSLCYTCSQRCPQGVDLAHLLIDLKNLSASEGRTPIGVLDEMKLVHETGMTAEMSKMIIKRRQKMGLPDLPSPDLEEIQKIMRATGFEDLLGVNAEVKTAEATS